MTKILGIKGHSTRGKEVIEIFEMLGGKNYYKFAGNSDCVYYIRNDSYNNNIIDYLAGYYPIDFMIFTLEEFIEKYPYKVGDKVLYKHDNTAYFIRKMFWENDKILYELSDEVYSDGCSIPDTLIFDVDVVKLQPYKEETFGECIEKPINECLFGGDEDTMVKENYSPITLLPVLDKVMIIPTNEDSEIIEENGKFYLVKKQQRYPKTYKECCDVLVNNDRYREILVSIPGVSYKANLIETFTKLLICRDAYWKIAGEEMDLGKPWEPDWDDDEWPDMYYISFDGKYLAKEKGYPCVNIILIFPTEEMRDTFFNNFKVLIEQCKELL